MIRETLIKDLEEQIRTLRRLKVDAEASYIESQKNLDKSLAITVARLKKLKEKKK